MLKDHIERYVDWSKVNPDDVWFEGGPVVPGERVKSNREIMEDSMRRQKTAMRLDELVGSMRSASDVVSALRDNVAGTLFSEVVVGGPAAGIDIDEAVAAMGVEICPEYRRFLEQIGYLRFKNSRKGYRVNVYGVGDSGRLSVAARTREARQAGLIPDNMYVIDRIAGRSIFPDKSYITQDATGVVFMVYPDGTAEPGWEDLLTYVKNRLDTALY